MTDYDNPSSNIAGLGNSRATSAQVSIDSDEPVSSAPAPSNGAAKAPAAARRPRRTRSRLTDGRTLLPGVNSQTAWVRLFADLNEAMLEHAGGADHATEPQRLTARRVALLETEMRFQEMKIAQIRAAGGEPDDRVLDLYARLSNSQKRHLEALGWARAPKEVVVDLKSYLAAKDD